MYILIDTFHKDCLNFGFIYKMYMYDVGISVYMKIYVVNDIQCV